MLNPGAAKTRPIISANRAPGSWYHICALGITRIICGHCLGLHHSRPSRQIFSQGLPSFIELGGNGSADHPGQGFRRPNITDTDPTWSAVSSATTPGSLWYARLRATWRRRQPPGRGIISHRLTRPVSRNSWRYDVGQWVSVPKITVEPGAACASSTPAMRGS